MLGTGFILLLFLRQLRLGKELPAPELSEQTSLQSSSKIRLFEKSGGRVDWSLQGIIAYDQRGDDGYFDVYTIKPDGSEKTCITCMRAEVSRLHTGNPAWHPNGKYLVFQVQAKDTFLGDEFSTPGKGVNNELWLTDAHGEKFWQLTDISSRKYFGVLHPHFSHDGRMLLWSEYQRPGGILGIWSLMLADFSLEGSTPRIANIRTFTPGDNPRFYESHGFTKDDEGILYTANSDLDQSELGLDIYVLKLQTQEVTNLTNTPREWDEHAQLSPDGKRIVWVTGRGNGRGQLDMWMMNSDGTEKKKLTYFHEAARPEYIGHGIGPADSSWSPDGRQLIAYVITDRKEFAGSNYIIDIE